MFARKSLLIILTNAGGALLGLVALFAIGRYMNPEALGMLGVALGIVGMGAFIGNVGFDKANTKRLSQGMDAATCLATYRVIKLVSLAAYVIIVGGAILLWHHWKGFTDATALSVLLVVVAYHGFNNLRNLPVSTFNAYQMTANAQAMAIIENVVRAPLIVVVALVFGLVNGRWVPFKGAAEWVADTFGVGGMSSAMGATLLAGAYAAGMGISLLAGHYLLRRNDFHPGRPDRDVARSYVAFALPIAVTSTLFTVAKQIDVVMVGYFWSASEGGFYYAAQRLTTVVLIIPTAVRTLFFPLMSELASKGERHAVNEVALSTQRTMSLIMVLATMFIILYAENGIHIFLSDRFLPAAPAVQWMAVHTLLVSLTTVEISIVMGFDRPKIHAIVGAVAIFVNVALNLVFIPDSLFGIPMLGLRATGAVLATVVGQVLTFTAMVVVARRLTGRFHLPLAILKHLGAAIITAGFLHLMHDTVVLGGVDRIWELGVAAVLGTAVYTILLIIIGEVGDKDVALARDLASPRKMAGYVSGELRRPDRP